MFRHDFTQNDAKTKPQSLAAAQLEHSISKMLQDTDGMKDELTQRDSMLRQVEDKNKDLQKKVDRFSATANQLADEKKAAINAGSEEKIDLDRRIAQLQGNVTRINGERDDVNRHMSTVKRLLEVSDQDMKTEKNKLQLAIVQFQTNETKLVTIEENMAEEMARKKILESKVISLGEEMRSVAEELRIKEGQIEERRRKIEADKLHYTQVMEEERSTAAQELRDLRQELIDEIAIRDRRYGEEKLRVAQESTERGRIQGVEDGTNEALLEADAKIQEYVLSVQRCKSEVEGMKIRLRQIKEQSEADQRRINAQSTALSRTLDELVSQNSTTEIELESLKATKVTVEEQTYDLLCQTLRGLSRPVGKKDLLTIIHELRIRKPVDFSFELAREEEERRRLDEERREVIEWTRATLKGSYPPPAMPSIRTKAPDDRPILSTYEAPKQVAPTFVAEPTPVAAEAPVETTESDQESVEDSENPVVDHHNDTEPLPPAAEEADEYGEDMPWGTPNDLVTPAAQPQASEHSEEESEKGIATPEPEEEDVPVATVEEQAEADDGAIKVSANQPYVDSDEEEPAEEAKPAPSPPPQSSEQDQPKRALPVFTDSDEEDKPPAPAPAPTAAKAPPKKATLFGDSDSEGDAPAASPKKAPAAAPKKAAPKRQALFDDDSD
eukprot:GILJ01016630.1.p1 GENE.GILJ01016630.1~~GILJ01016630.1.p1  ORF type:complete len:668 (+),score=176.19 GILJ01016630.1:1-2004(+)